MKLYPSEINNYSDTLVCNLRNEVGDVRIAQLRTEELNGDEFKSLILLLVSAPDLLEVLQDVLATTPWNRIGNDALHKALAAIERVTGETYSPSELP
jgi:hypothetical protein